ncbi:MAG: hypothetical protein ABS938_03155 [Psychrobacillus psychrodurans]
MSRTRIINLIGWIFIIFLTIVYLYFSERFSVITTGFGGLVCIIIGAALVFYKPRAKSKE